MTWDDTTLHQIRRLARVLAACREITTGDEDIPRLVTTEILAGWHSVHRTTIRRRWLAQRALTPAAQTLSGQLLWDDPADSELADIPETASLQTPPTLRTLAHRTHHMQQLTGIGWHTLERAVQIGELTPDLLIVRSDGREMPAWLLDRYAVRALAQHHLITRTRAWDHCISMRRAAQRATPIWASA